MVITFVMFTFVLNHKKVITYNVCYFVVSSKYGRDQMGVISSFLEASMCTAWIFFKKKFKDCVLYKLDVTHVNVCMHLKLNTIFIIKIYKLVKLLKKK